MEKHLIDRDRFTFYKSYYDTYKELPIKDRPEFIETIMAVYFLEKKIEDVKPSTPMLKLAFSSISHSIKTSIKGLFDKLGIEYNSYPWQGGTQGACQQYTISNKQQAIDNKKQEIDKLEDFSNWKWQDDKTFIEWLNTKEVLMDTNSKAKFNSNYINTKKEQVILHCQSKGVTYKNYRSALQNWINRDISEGKL